MPNNLNIRVSVVIPARNEQAQITACIKSAWQAGASEVIVVDGNSHDQTVERASTNASLVLKSDPGRAIQLNRGAAMATGEILLFLHADNRLGNAAISQIQSLVQSVQEPVCGAFRQSISKGGFRYRMLETGNAWRAVKLGIPYGDQALFFTSELFNESGGFPEFPIMEDLAFMWKLRHRCWPRLLDGPVHVSPRRWEKHGILRQTLRNWMLATAWVLGCPPRRLAHYYPEHHSTKPNDVTIAGWESPFDSEADVALETTVVESAS